ncbi:hypothetical protein ACTMTJ_37110 [Phytohabitans sp. LJ34]|uniref:hypothetical protein n=1 Tax=Phytohabitans sp. LJ34 TaxID=3452217 RepID=UPI003F8BE146
MVATVGLARPALADWQPKTPEDMNEFTELTDAYLRLTEAFGGGGGGGGGGPELEEAIRQIIEAVEQAKDQIVQHIDEITSAEVQACVRTHTIEFADIENMSRTVLQLWAQDATFCASQATEYFSAVSTLRAADNIGFLTGEIYMIASAARAKAGFSIVALVENNIRANEAIIARLTPTNCAIKRHPPEQGTPPERWWECTAYNGDVGRSGICTGFACQPNRAVAEDRATLKTSRAIAKDALPRLRAALEGAA